MRKRVSGICVVVFFSAALVAPGLLVIPNAAAETVSWTLALYINGDNNLEDEWDGTSLPLLLNIPANSEVNIVAMVDLMSTDGTDLVEISGGSWEVVNSYPEKNFGDGATLQWFITEVTTLYPSDNLGVTMWDHGYGWIECSYDETSRDRVRMNEMKAAIEGANVHIDILSFDACNMGNIEVAYEAYTTGLVDYMVGSEESVPFDGYPYDFMWTPVANDETRTPAQVCVDMVNGWGQYYDNTTFNSVTLSAVDVLSIGAGVDLADVRSRLGHRVALQGNVDHRLLVTGSFEQIDQAVRDCIEAGDHQGHILNLGSGLDKDTPFENVCRFIETAKTFVATTDPETVNTR